MIDRRFVLAGGLCALAATAGRAQGAPFLGDDGKPVPTWRLPPEISLDLPGLIVAGGANPDAQLYEFFDYNCPFCRKSAPDLEKLVAKDKDFSLRLVQNPILSLGSVQAAKVALATLAVAGPARAWALHRAMLAHRGPIDGPGALAHVAALKLDRAAIEAKADSDVVGKVLSLQSHTARDLGMEATLSFAMNGMGVGGWPGPKTIARMIRNVRSCERIAC